MADAPDDVVILHEEAPAAGAVIPEGVAVIGDERDDEDPLPKHAVPQPDGSVRLLLLHPVVLRWKRPNSDEIREERYDELHLHRLTGKDLMAVMAAGKGAMSVVCIGRSTRIPQARMNELFERMDGSDASAAAQVAMSFLAPGRKTGPSS